MGCYRGSNRTVAAVSLGVVASIVSSRNHHHDSSLPGLLHRHAQRVHQIRTVHRPTERQVHYANVVLILEVNGEFDAGDDTGVRSHAAVVEHLMLIRLALGAMPRLSKWSWRRSSYCRARQNAETCVP